LAEESETVGVGAVEMAGPPAEMMSGVVDPETLYTKQNCIGMGHSCSQKTLEVWVFMSG
jgi:hypothetical protein